MADQLRELADFLMEHTGKSIDEENLKTRLKRSRRTLDLYRQFQQERAEKYVPTDILTPLYCGMTTHILLGTEEEERYMNMCLEGIRQAPPARGKRIYWMHTLPFWSDALKEKLDWSERAQIVGCDMVQDPDVDWDPSRPYEAMAKRLVYHAFNGNVTRRIEAGIRHAREVHADGAVWFNHWGCKHTMGGAQLAREKFGAAGIPLLILDGDGCDRSRGGEGQTATRMEAFLEMLEKTGADGGIRR